MWGVFNGEIYNHAGCDTASRGEVMLHTRTDTETILHLRGARRSGRGTPARHVCDCGVDRRRRRLLLARDRLGIKPLYYACTPRELLFAFEIKAIVEAGLKPVLNDAILPEFLLRGMCRATRRSSGVKLLPHTLTWSQEEGFARRRFWQIPAPASGGPPVIASLPVPPICATACARP